MLRRGGWCDGLVCLGEVGGVIGEGQWCIFHILTFAWSGCFAYNLLLKFGLEALS